MKIIVIGASGFLGTKLMDTIEKNKHMGYGSYNKNTINQKNYFKMDITNKKQVVKNFNRINPDVVIHADGFTRVDHCEKNPEKTYKVNVKSTDYIAKKLKNIECKFVYISTDSIFDGKKKMYKEEDKPNPINYYGKTKMEAENIVKETTDNYLILRSSILYGYSKKHHNFFNWVYNNLTNNKKIQAATDLYNTPGHINNIAEIIIKLVEKEKTGIFNVAGPTRINRYDFALKIAHIFNLNKDLIEHITSDKLNFVGKRPKECTLDISKISKIQKPIDINKGLKEIKKEINL